MQRNPREEKKKNYFKYLKIRKFTPLFLFYQCDKCKNKFKRETMYKRSEPSIVGFSWDYYKRECTHCFANKSEFRKWLEDTGKILTESNFEDGADPRRLTF